MERPAVSVDLVDPDAPWGINPRTNKPYKRDPGPFAHLRNKPFGTSSAEAKALDAPGQPPRKRAKERAPKTPPKGTPEAYASILTGWATAGGHGLMARGNPAPDEPGPRYAQAGIVLLVQADDLGRAWGPMAVRFAPLGRLIDKTQVQSEAALAVTTAAQTFVMMARAIGAVPDAHPAAKVIDRMIAKKFERIMTSNPDLFAEVVEDAGPQAVPDETAG